MIAASRALENRGRTPSAWADPIFGAKMAKNGLFFEGGGFLGVIFFSHNMLTFSYQKFLQKCDVKSLGGGGAMLF